jgi:mono/diheme cytochrome c family protein
VTQSRFIVLSSVVLLLTGALWARVGTLVNQAPPNSQRLSNPFEGQSRAARAGAKLFAGECATCHGAEGRGLRTAPPLYTTDVQEASPGALFWVLRNGSLKRGMPSFAHLPEPQRWQIITYLKTLKGR